MRMEIHRPDVRDLKSGDILWRRRWVDVIPDLSWREIWQRLFRFARPQVENVPPIDLFHTGKARLLAKQAARLGANHDYVRRLQKLKAPRPTGGFHIHLAGVEFGSHWGMYVGHPAVVDVVGSRRYVIDATQSYGGVAITRFDKWIETSPQSSLWHGRLKYRSESELAKIAQAAASVKGKPYEFFELDLADDSGFYCSKFIWWAIYKALNVAIDDDPDSTRNWWLLPRDTAACACFERLYWPAEF